VYHSAVIVALLLAASLSGQTRPPECTDVPSCRQAAIDAAGRQDYETFHDLAWRAVQKGRPNHSELMLLLARAQSLSGRPGDALVMLRRLAAMGVAADVEGEDFRRVRALGGWAEVEALIAAVKEKPAAGNPERDSQKTASSIAREVNTTPPSVAGAVAPSLAKRAAAEAAAAPGRSAAAGGEEAIRIPARSIEPVGLAYDTVSRRFVVGDRRHNKLIVADEVFKRVNDLIGAGSGGFGSLTALEIDRNRGDLWVTSTENGTTSVHKLQLVSGRVLSRIDLPPGMDRAAITDIGLAESGALLLLDAAGARLLSLSPSGRSFSRPVPLEVTSPRSVAAAGTVAYIAHDKGLVAADLQSGSVAEVQAADGVTIDGLQRIRWYRGSLVAIQSTGDTAGAGGTAGTRLVRIRLSRSGRSASAVAVLDDHAAGNGSALTVSDDQAYYLAEDVDGPVIRRVPLR
jgi:hypothetical protein